MIYLNDLLAAIGAALGALAIVALAANLIWMATQEQPAQPAPRPPAPPDPAAPIIILLPPADPEPQPAELWRVVSTAEQIEAPKPRMLEVKP